MDNFAKQFKLQQIKKKVFWCSSAWKKKTYMPPLYKDFKLSISDCFCNFTATHFVLLIFNVYISFHLLFHLNFTWIEMISCFCLIFLVFCFQFKRFNWYTVFVHPFLCTRMHACACVKVWCIYNESTRHSYSSCIKVSRDTRNRYPISSVIARLPCSGFISSHQIRLLLKASFDIICLSYWREKKPLQWLNIFVLGCHIKSRARLQRPSENFGSNVNKWIIQTLVLLNRL